MRGMKRILLLIWLSLMIMWVKEVSAQGPPQLPCDPPGHREEREKIRESIQTLRMWKLLEALDLSSEQSIQFLPAYKDFQNARKTFDEKRRKLLKKLEEELESGNDQKRLRKILMELEDVRKQFQAELDKFWARSKAILTLKQQAQLVLFEEKFERRLKETIERLRGGPPRLREFER